MKKIIVSIFAFISTLCLWAQTENSATDIIDYREVDGRIVVKALVNGVEGDFLLDLAGHNAIQKECLAKFKINTSETTTFNGYNSYLYKKVAAGNIYKAESASVGNNASGNGIKFIEMMDEPYLRELGIDGVLGSSLFRGTVLTIDTRRKKLTTTIPFRPPYMKLDYRTNSQTAKGLVPELTLRINGTDCKVLFDTWHKGVVAMTESDFAQFSNGKTPSTDAAIGIGYGKEKPAEKQVKGDVSFVKSSIKDASISENKSLPRSVAGLGILKENIVAIDFSKEKIYFQPYDLVAIDDNSLKPKEVVIKAGMLNPITRDYFIENIFDYKKSKEFVSKCDKLVVIDFWATWCGPCMKLLPQMEALAAKYKEKVIFMKVNADKEKELCNTFKIQALPTIFFIPPGGKPTIEIGVTPEKVEEIIKKML